MPPLALFLVLALAGDVGGQATVAPLKTAGSPADAEILNFDSKIHTYPWKTGIPAGIFWIGEEATKASAWDANRIESNGGADTPTDMNGYVSGSHATRVNPFYVALPFNDLAYPDKARQWLPPGWAKPVAPGGKPVSVCEGRWLEIKNRQGFICYAQWEDVGPKRADDAEYVFGSKRPADAQGVGIDVSPAVAKYLGLEGKNDALAWRFVDAADVPPGYWLKYSEEAVLFEAMHQLHDSSKKSEAEASHPSEATTP